MKIFFFLSFFMSASLWANSDVEQLLTLVNEREDAMQTKNLSLAMKNFSKDIVWINSQGYYFKGFDSVKDLHNMMMTDKSRDYQYSIGKPLVKILDRNNAIVYYPWRMLWHKPQNISDVVFDEVGLMTLNASKSSGHWKWVAITVQHTPWFYETIEPVEISH